MIEVPTGVASGYDLLEAYYKMLRQQAYYANTVGTQVKLKVGTTFARLVVPKGAVLSSPVGYADEWEAKSVPSEIFPAVQAMIFMAGRESLTGDYGNLGEVLDAGGFITIAGNGETFLAVESSTTKVAVSIDGLRWVGLSPMIPNGSIDFCLWNGSEWVVYLSDYTGGYAAIYTSPDAIEWTMAAGPFAYADSPIPSYPLAYDGNLYVTLRPNQKVYTSPDGVTWTERLDTLIGGQLAYCDGLFLIVGPAGYVEGSYYSEDGVNWTPFTAPADLPAGVLRVVGDKFFYGANWGSAAYALSSDAVEWTDHNLPTVAAGAAYFFSEGGKLFYFYSDSWDALTHFYVTADGVNWTAGELPVVVAADSLSLTYDGATFLLVASARDEHPTTALISGDGLTWVAENGSPAIVITQEDIDRFNNSHDDLKIEFGAPKPLSGGSSVLVTAPEGPIAVRGSIGEVTAPPLAVVFSGALLECTSSVELPRADINSAGALVRSGVPFTVEG